MVTDRVILMTCLLRESKHLKVGGAGLARAIVFVVA